VGHFSNGDGTVACIRALLTDIPLGKNCAEIVLELRQELFINEIIFYSETWQAPTQIDIDDISKTILICFDQ
jgi:hypothetical protein